MSQKSGHQILPNVEQFQKFCYWYTLYTRNPVVNRSANRTGCQWAL